MTAALAPALYLVIGAGLGWLCARFGGDRFERRYPAIMRTHVVTSSLALSVVAAWRAPFTLAFVVPLAALLVADTAWGLGAYRVLRRGEHREQAAALAMAGGPNTGFWAIPAAGALAGPAGVLAAVVYDRMAVLRYAVMVRLLRKDAPVPQSKASGWVDQIALAALAAGLLLRLAGPAPSWTQVLLTIAGPLLSVTGGFVLGAALPRVAPKWADLRHATTLTVSRYAALGAPVVAAAALPGRVSTAVVLAAGAVATSSAPFSGAGMAKMYGYRVEPVIATLPVSLLLSPLALTVFATTLT